MVATRTNWTTRIVLGSTLLLASALAGCSGGNSGGLGGVELNGTVFDVAGLNSSQKDKNGVKLAERAPLVPPPQTDRLPLPGAAASAGPGDHLSWPQEPELVKKQGLTAEQLQKQKDCETKLINRPEPEIAAQEAKCATLLSTLTGYIIPQKKEQGPAPLREGEPETPKVSPATAQAWQTNTQQSRK